MWWRFFFFLFLVTLHVCEVFILEFSATLMSYEDVAVLAIVAAAVSSSSARSWPISRLFFNSGREGVRSPNVYSFSLRFASASRFFCA